MRLNEAKAKAIALVERAFDPDSNVNIVFQDATFIAATEMTIPEFLAIPIDHVAVVAFGVAKYEEYLQEEKGEQTQREKDSDTG